MTTSSRDGIQARGTCSECDRKDVRLLKDGTVGLHHDPRRRYDTISSRRCKGWGRPPKQDSITTVTTAEHPSHGTCTHCGDRKRLTKGGVVFNHYDGRIPPRPQQGWCLGSGEKPKEAIES